MMAPLLGLLVAAAGPAEACPLGTPLTMTTSTTPARFAGRLPDRVRYVRTQTIHASGTRCRLRLEKFGPNTSAAGFAGGRFAWLGREGGSRIVDTLALPDAAGRLVPWTGWPLEDPCDPRAVASTTYGPLRSCAALYPKGSGSELRITRDRRAREGNMIVTLPYRYNSITAGGWAHAVGGELALGRAVEGGAAIDIFALTGA